MSSRSSGALPATLESSRSRSQRPTFTRQTLARIEAGAGGDLDDDRFAVMPDGGLHGQLIDVGLQIFLALPTALIESLEEVSLAIKQSNADEGNVEVGGALDVVSSENAQAAGIDGQRFVQAELGGKIGDGAGSQDAGIGGSPGAVGMEILLLAAVAVVDAAVQDEFRGAAFDFTEGNFTEQRDGILIQLAPANRIQIAKEADTVVVPAPPEIAGQGPEALLSGGDEAIEGAGFADHRRDFTGGVDQHANFIFAKDAAILGLNYQNTLQDTTVDERHTEEGVVDLFAGFDEVLETGMIFDLFDGDGQNLFGDQAGQAFVERHAQGADTSWVQTQGRSQDQVRSIRLQQIGGADVGSEPGCDQCDDIHEGVGRLAAFFGEVCDFL